MPPRCPLALSLIGNARPMFVSNHTLSVPTQARWRCASLRPVLSVPQCFLPVLQCPQSMLVSLSTHSSFLLMPHFNHQHFSMHSDHFMWLTSMVTAESEFSLQFIFYMLSVFQTARSLQAFGLRLREYMNEMFSPKTTPEPVHIYL